MTGRIVDRKPSIDFLHLGNPKTFVQPLHSPVKLFTGGHIRAFLQLFLLTFNFPHNALLSVVPRIIGLKSSPLRCLKFPD